MLTLEDVLENVDGLEKTGPEKWRALCPLHADTHPSLGIMRGDKVAIVMKCFACRASFEDLLNAIEARKWIGARS